MKAKIYITSQSATGGTDEYNLTVQVLSNRFLAGTMNVGDVIIDRFYTPFKVTDPGTINGVYNENVIVTRIYGTYPPQIGSFVAMIYEVITSTNLSDLPESPIITIADYDLLRFHRNTVNTVDNLRTNVSIEDGGIPMMQNTDKIYLATIGNHIINSDYDEDFVDEQSTSSTTWVDLYQYTMDLEHIDPLKYAKEVKSMFGYFRFNSKVANVGETAELKVVVSNIDGTLSNDVTDVLTVNSDVLSEWIRSGTMDFTESMTMPFKLKVMGRVTSGSGTLTTSISNQTNVSLTYIYYKL